MLVINDVHLAVNRMAGTTPGTQIALREYLRHQFQEVLEKTNEKDVVINGDLFDGFSVDIIEVVKTYELFADWLNVGRGRRLYLIQGNHDSNPRADKMSSFHFLCRFLEMQFFAQFSRFDRGFEQVKGSVWCIPHQPNQSLFDLELSKAAEMEVDGAFLLLHCNYKNTFAEHSDHSLNLSDDQVGALMRAGWNLILGHEHQGYELRGGRVVVVGNQFPSSCSDCIGEKGKRALIINDDRTYDFLPTWIAAKHYIEVPWNEIEKLDEDYDFIRVVGECTSEQSADMIATVAKLRQDSGAFVVSNSVRVAGMVEMEALTALTVENVSRFSVMDALMELLDDKEQEKIKELMQ